VARNIIANQAANSSACIAIANSASTGVISDNRVSVLLGSTATIQGIVFTSTGSLIRCFENYCSDEKQKSGILTPTAAT
jgi:hypothetical protein